MNNPTISEFLQHPGLAELPMGPWLNAHLQASTQHALQSRGGGFRARLVVSLCRACALEKDRSTALATSLEYFHLASLILDDLPCMDNAETRRGLPCTHRVYGESMAILSALALINRAYFHVWEGLHGLPEELRQEANQLLDQCLGLDGILNGQALDLKFNTTDRSAGTIERIALLKTGSLLRLSLLLPWIAAGGDALGRQALRRLADKWGCIYQLLDDFKDLEWGENASGKTPLRDAVLDRPNLALALGREAAILRLRKNLNASRQLVDQLAAKHGLGDVLEGFQHQLEETGQAFLAACAA